MKQNKNITGFTLIELLVVVAIIGLLSSIVLASLNSARVKARDAKRAADIKQLATAISFYYDDNNEFPSTNGGCPSAQSPNGNGWCCLGIGDTATCWATLLQHGSAALDNSLSPKYIPQIPDDPLNNTSKYGDAYAYKTDIDANGEEYATLHWGIENSNPTSQTCAGGTVSSWGSGLGNGGDYHCALIVR